MCITLILTNKSKHLQDTGEVETAVSDDDLLIFLFLKTTFTTISPSRLDVTRFLNDVPNLGQNRKMNTANNGKIQFVRVLN